MVAKNSIWFINSFLKKTKNQAVFTHFTFQGEVNWVAANRAAKRFLSSNKIKNLAKKFDINIIEEDELLILN